MRTKSEKGLLEWETDFYFGLIKKSWVGGFLLEDVCHKPNKDIENLSLNLRIVG